MIDSIIRLRSQCCFGLLLLVVPGILGAPSRAAGEESRPAVACLVELQQSAPSVRDRLAATRALIRLDYWKLVDDAALNAYEEGAQEDDDDLAGDRAVSDGYTIDIAWTMAWRWHFDSAKQTPWIDRLVKIANEDPQRLTEVLLALLDLEADVSPGEDNQYDAESSNARAVLISRLEELAESVDSQADSLAPIALGVLIHSTSSEATRNIYRRALVRLTQQPESASAAATVLIRLPGFGAQIVREEVLDGESTEGPTFDPTAKSLVALYFEKYFAENGLDREDESRFPETLDSLIRRDATSQYASLILAQVGDAEEANALRDVYVDDRAVPSLRIVAAYASLRIERREVKQLAWLDWGVIAAYALGMIGIGIFYALRTKNAEEYLLGGRRMAPSLVGLSMFASLLSTLTYLAQPGEVIRNGPMTLVQVVSYPFVFVVVGWLLIPFIMRMKVTSGYEMLEKRLGVSSRLLGSTIFLVLRLLWMATIIYVTTSTVLIPMIGWSSSMTPVVCAAIGVITIVYTSLGGLRAVVVTDAVQTAILFGGALLAILLITLEMGGVSEWWPSRWQAQWQEPVWFDPSVRTSFIGLFLAMFSWQVCTNGSDQMAIQRFLATGDVSSARRVLLVSLVTSAVVIGFLVCLGLALMSYLEANPSVIPDDQSLFTDSDRMLPAFIVRKLPVGVAGLVIAGLLAAAMSSLSSGVNSSCSVISSDFVERFRKRSLSDQAQVRLARWSSVVVGALVVGLSLYVSSVSGNIFELCFKIANLFVGPLFLLFFLAFFVKHANSIGAWAGVISAAATAIVIGFWDSLFQGPAPFSFVWLTPLSFAVGLVVSWGVSWMTQRAAGERT